MKSEFVKWVKSEYSKYGDTPDKLIDIAMYFAEKGNFDLYVDYLKRHFNNAFSDFSDVNREVDAAVIAGKLSGNAIEVLYQVIESPKYDGDVASKQGKSELFGHKLILRIANNNSFGDNAANGLGFSVWKALEDRKVANK